jgi:cobyrinic acid a,c-diamide synthase
LHTSPLPWPKSLTGHEFHYSSAVAQSSAPLFSATDALGTELAPTGAVVGRVMGSYAHVIDAADA